jgi:hypothetical protein
METHGLLSPADQQATLDPADLVRLATAAAAHRTRRRLRIVLDGTDRIAGAIDAEVRVTR